MILLVTRSTYWSRGRVQADAAVIDALGKVLQSGGHDIRTVSEKELCMYPDLLTQPQMPSHIFSMARNRKSLKTLASLYCKGACVINSEPSVRLCTNRVSQWYALQHINKCRLKGAVLDGKQKLSDLWNTFPCWVKTNTMAYFVPDRDSFPDIKGKFVVMEHIPGSIIKCYAVKDKLIGWRYMTAALGRFGQERYNDIEQYRFDADNLKALVRTVVQRTGLSVFGFDAVVAPSGAITVIDINDWPSFGGFVGQAAHEIAMLALNITDNGKE